MSPQVGFALACALHAGFQVTVTLLVYPALGRTPAADWVAVHARHSRTIAPLVGVVYAALLVAGGALLLGGPGAAGWLALVATAAALGLTALVAAPLHGSLAERDPVRVGRLLVADRWRCAAAVLGALAAVVAAW